MIPAAIQTLLWNNQPATSRLSLYNFGGTTKPAVFCAEVAPLDAETPLVTINPEGSGEFGTRGQRGGILDVRVALWCPVADTTKNVEAIGMLLWVALDRASITMLGYGSARLEARLPVSTKDQDGFPGRIINVQVNVLEDL